MNAEQLISSQPRAHRGVGAEWTIACPWHQERTPSCCVNVSKRVFICHGCGERGRLSKLVARLQNISLREAALLIGEEERYGAPEQTDALRLPDIFRRLPEESYFGKEAMHYLVRRGITREQVIRHSIGFCSAGRFAFRVIVPIYLDGALVSFVARDWTGKAEQKVRYPAGSRAADAIFNYDSAQNYAETVVITEGWADALAVERALQTDRYFARWAALAIGGKELTESKRALLSVFRDFVVMLDSDAKSAALNVGVQLEALSSLNRARLACVSAKDPAEESIENLIRILR